MTSIEGPLTHDKSLNHRISEQTQFRLAHVTAPVNKTCPCHCTSATLERRQPPLPLRLVVKPALCPWLSRRLPTNYCRMASAQPTLRRKPARYASHRWATGAAPPPTPPDGAAPPELLIAALWVASMPEAAPTDEGVLEVVDLGLVEVHAEVGDFGDFEVEVGVDVIDTSSSADGEPFSPAAALASLS